MSNKETPANFDPMKAWREWFVKNEREWSESLTRMMKTDEMARAIGQDINASVHMEQMFAQNMSGTFAKMNMPTRQDIVALGERIGQLEDAVARVEAALVQMKAGATDAKRPPRTRKPPSKTGGAG